MTKLYIVTLVVTSLLICQAALANRAVPQRLRQLHVEPTCLAVGTGYLTNQPGDFGTFGQGPSIKLSNRCEYEIVIQSVMTVLSTDSPLSPFVGVRALLVEPIQEYFSFKMDKEAKFCENLASGKDKDAQTCSSVLLREGAYLTYPMYWGYHYSISGFSRVSKETKVIVEGQMLTREVASAENSKELEEWVLANNDATKVTDTNDPTIQFKEGIDALEWAGYERAAADLHKAAVNNHLLAQIYLGVLYAKGTGVTQNYAKSYFWISHGKRHGGKSFRSADAYLLEAKSHLTAEQIASLDKRAEIKLINRNK